MARDEAMRRALDGKQRGDYVAGMFGRIAERYDLLNRLMSLGQDQRWRRRMAVLADVPRGGVALDLATGTGDVALALLDRDPTATVIGADFAVPMMEVGQRKVPPGASLSFAAADALAMPFPNEQFDAVLHAFLMRNIADIPGGFREQWRMLKPGGRVVCLEIVGPPAGVGRMVYSLFFETVVPKLGALLSASDAYQYLPQSVLRFPAPSELSQMMREAGFVAVRYERVMLGSVAIHTAQKAVK